MATEEQIDKIIQIADAMYPTKLLKKMDTLKAGINAVLRLLDELEEPVTAGTISEYMHVSTARVAVLLKKMESKGLITRTSGTHDARVTIVRLTPYGEKTIQNIKQNMRKDIAQIIDEIGIERLKNAFEVMKEIRKIIENSQKP